MAKSRGKASEYEDDDGEDGAMDAAHSENLAMEIPSRLLTKVTECWEGLLSATIERKVGDTWRSTRRRFSYGGPPPSMNVEDICMGIVETVSKLTEEHGRDQKFRVMLNIREGSGAGSRPRRLFVPVSSEIMDDGEILVSDGSDISEREHLHILNKVIESQDERHNALFTKAMEMLDKANDTSEKMVEQAAGYAAGIAGIGSSLKQVVDACTGVLEKAARLVGDHQREHVAIQLAKMDAESERQKIGAAFQLLNKVGGPLAQQVMKALGGAPETPSKAAEKVQAAIEGEKNSPEKAVTPEIVVPEEQQEVKKEQSISERLILWISSCTEEMLDRLPELIGREQYAALVMAADSKDDGKCSDALAAFKAHFTAIAFTNTKKVEDTMKAIEALIGTERATIFAGLLPD